MKKMTRKIVSSIVSAFVGITAITIGNLGTYYMTDIVIQIPYYPEGKNIVVFVIYNILCATVCALVTYAIINFKSKKHRKKRTGQKKHSLLK